MRTFVATWSRLGDILSRVFGKKRLPAFENLTVPYHQQEEYPYCGAACAQMILHAAPLRQPLYNPNNPDDRTHKYLQANLHDQNITNSIPPWVTDPSSLANTLQSCQPTLPPVAPGHFRVFPEPSPLALTRRVIWAIYKHRIPAAVLVWGRLHWVIVVGYNIRGKNGFRITPAVSTPTGETTATDYVVKGLMIHNPVPPVAVVTGGMDVPPPHGEPYDLEDEIPPYRCGEGIVMIPLGTDGNLGSQSSNRGVEAHHVSYVGWQCEYLDSPVDSTVQEWDNKYIAVCATDLSANDRASSTMPDSDKNLYSCPDKQSTAIAPATAVEVAWEQMLAHDLKSLPLWRQVLDFKNAGTPQPVMRPDGPQPRGYYLVPFLTADGLKTPVVARVDMYSKTYFESVAVRGTKAVADVDPKATNVRGFAALTAADGTTFLNANGHPVDPRDLSLPRAIVWRPCLQSFNPFDPFYEFEDELGDVFYVRIYDQRAFRLLDFDIGGGH
jgi:hypothetical protein